MKKICKNTTSRDRPMMSQEAITLIALVITIIILLILAGVSIKFIFGEDGIIVKAQLSAFATEMKAIKEKVDLKKNENAMATLEDGMKRELFETKLYESNLGVKTSLKQEILYARDGFPSDKSPSDYTKDDFEKIDKATGEDGNVTIVGIYIIDKETADGKENTYIWDANSDVVFKIPPTTIGGKVYHSYETTSIAKGGIADDEKTEQDQLITDESIEMQVGDEYYYSPDMSGFNASKTYLVYYNYTEGAEDNFTKSKEVPVKEYIESGQKNEIEVDGEKYILHDYGNKVWANAKTVANGLEAWWVWVPRYAYQVDDENKKMNIIFTNTKDVPMNPQYNGALPEGYQPHPGFTVDGQALKGIWMSKYEPSITLDHIMDSSQCYAPDMTGFDTDFTYIELYNSQTQDFDEIKLADADLNTVNNDNKWYDYKNKIWANVKTTGNGIEAWWVWIPRYAYKINGNVTESNIIFIDLDNKPIDTENYGDTLPEGYIIHPAFTPTGEDGSENLKGIWMSKYEPSETYDYMATSSTCYAPDMDGFDKEYTYIELYDSTTGTFSQELQLKDVNLSEINKENKWYDYKNKVWANIKTTANDLEAWWVWIPRYAYKITNPATEANIIFVDLKNKPMDTVTYGDSLPEGYIVHPAFTPSGEDGSDNLKGIWMSKYEPSNK